MRKLLSLGLVALMLAAVIAGCTPAASPSTEPVDNSTAPTTAASDPADPTTAPDPAAAGPKEITWNFNPSDPPDMFSVTATDVSSGNILRHVMEGLVKYDTTDTIIPAMAESWTVSDDSRTYTFIIRQGATWSNGEPVTAHDFAFAWNLLFTAETAAEYAPQWGLMILGATEMLAGEAPSAEVQAELTELGYDTVGFKAIDDYTFQVTTTNAYAYFVDTLAFVSFLPVNEKAYTEIGAENYALEAETMVYNGAYTMTNWVHQASFVLEKRADYYDAANINIEKINAVMLPDSNTSLTAFQAGEIDLTGLTGAQAAQLRDEGRTDLLGYDDASVWYFEFNHTKPGLNNVKIRTAMTMAIDTEIFINDILKQPLSKVAVAYTPYAINGGAFTEEVAALNLYPRVTDGDYSAVLAMFEEGLAEEGLTREDLDLTIFTDEGDTALLNVSFFQEQWKTHLNLDVAVEQMSFESRLERMTAKDFSLVMAGWSMDYNDPMTYLDLMVSDNGNNHTSYNNPEYDQLIADALVEPDFETRKQMLIECEKIIARDMPVGMIYYRARDYVLRPGLTGVYRSANVDISFLYADVVPAAE